MSREFDEKAFNGWFTRYMVPEYIEPTPIECARWQFEQDQIELERLHEKVIGAQSKQRQAEFDLDLMTQKVNRLEQDQAAIADEPTATEINKAVDTIRDLALFAANHNCFTLPVPELVRVFDWLKSKATEGKS